MGGSLGIFKQWEIDGWCEEPEAEEREPTAEEWEEFERREERLMAEYEAECEAKKLRIVRKGE